MLREILAVVIYMGPVFFFRMSIQNRFHALMLAEHLVHIMILSMLCLDVSGVVNDVVLHSMLPSYTVTYTIFILLRLGFMYKWGVRDYFVDLQKICM